MKSYTLRRIDPELWKKFKSKAAYEGRPMKFVLCELARIYAEHGFQVVETFDGQRRKK